MCHETRTKLTSFTIDLDSFCLSIQRELHLITAVRQAILLFNHLISQLPVFSTPHRIPMSSSSLSGINLSLLQTGAAPGRWLMISNTRITTRKNPFTTSARLCSRVGAKLTKSLASECGVLNISIGRPSVCGYLITSDQERGAMIWGLVKISGIGGSSSNERVSEYTRQVGSGLIFWWNQDSFNLHTHNFGTFIAIIYTYSLGIF